MSAVTMTEDEMGDLANNAEGHRRGVVLQIHAAVERLRAAAYAYEAGDRAEFGKLMQTARAALVFAVSNADQAAFYEKKLREALGGDGRRMKAEECGMRGGAA